MDASFYAPAGAALLPAQPRPAPPPRVMPDSAPPGFQIHPNTPRLRLEDLKTPGGDPMIGPDGLLIPPARSVAMVVNSALRVFSYRFDEAMRDNFVNARAMRRDAFIRGLMEERILPTINRRWEIDIDDDKNSTQVLVRDQMAKIVRATPMLDAFKRALMDGAWFGRAGAQWNLYRNQDVDDFWTLRKWDPIHGDSIQYTFDGVPAVLMDSQTAGWYSGHGATWGPGGDLRPTDRGGTALVLQRPYWRSRFAIHVHMREKADYFEGELAGSVQGLGLRGLVYWHYVIRTEALTWMLTYMQAVGQMDLLVFNYPQGDDAAKQNAEAMARKIIGKAAIAAPYNPDKGNKPTVEQVPMNEAGLKALHELINDYFDRHIERLIVGQSMSSGADNDSGLGGTGRAEFAKACVPVVGSEILTRDGFKSPDSVQVGDEVLAYDPETDRCLWTPLLKKSFFEDCPVDRLFLEQNRFEAFCTPDHSWAVEKPVYPDRRPNRMKPEGLVAGPRGAMRCGDPKRYLKKAFDISKKENIILAAVEDETTDSILTPVEAAVLGWIVTDGGIKWSDRKFKGRRCRAFICQSKEEYIPVIRELVTAFQGETTESVFHTPERTFPMSGNTSKTKPQHSWDIPHDRATALFAKCGFSSRADLPRIVTRLSQPARAAMLEAMMMGDGTSGSTMQRHWPKSKSLGTFTNTDPDIIAAFEILCVLEGRATGKLDAREKDPRYKQCYDKTIKSNRYVYGNYLQREDAGRADVWCPTTKYGTWVMRQNGRVMITGNTKDEILLYDSNRLDETLTSDFLGPLKKANFPWFKFPLRWKSILPDSQAKEKVANGQTLIAAGVTIKMDEFREAAGYARPEEGDEVIGGPQTMGMGVAPGTNPNAPMHVAQPGGMPGQAQPPGNAPAQTYPRSTPPPEPQSGPQPPKPPHAATTIGMPQPVRNDMGGMGNGGGGAGPGPGGGPGTVPHMGYPGGGNTYIPKFGNRRRDLVGFTRYDGFSESQHPRDAAGKFTGVRRAKSGHETHTVEGKRVEPHDAENVAKARATLGQGFADLKHGPGEIGRRLAESHTGAVRQVLAALREGRVTPEQAGWVANHDLNRMRRKMESAVDNRVAVLRADVAHAYGQNALQTPEWAAVEGLFDNYRKRVGSLMADAADEVEKGVRPQNRRNLDAVAAEVGAESSRLMPAVAALFEKLRSGGKRYVLERPPTLYAKMGCLQAPLYGEAGMAVLRAGAGIDDSDLAAKGREDEPHVTVRYGFPAHITAADVAGVIGRPGPVKLKLGKIGFFAGDEFDVVYVAVESADLHVLHAQLGALPHTDTHEHYHPHATVAYVKPGLGKIYAERIPACDLDWTVAELDYKTPDSEPVTAAGPVTS